MGLRSEMTPEAPPQSREAEECLIAALLTDVRSIDIVLPLVQVDDFYVDAHRRIYQACVELHAVSQPVDLTTVCAQLGPVHLPAIGGIAYLARLCDVTPTVANLGAYCRIIADKAILRRTIQVANLIASHAAKSPKNVPEFIERTERAVYELARGRATSKAPSLMYDLSMDCLQRLQSAAERGGGVAGTPTGFGGLDDLTTGFHPGELVILAARPGMGKTGLATQIALNVAATGAGAMFFSLEMPKEQIADRLIGSEGRVSVRALRTGQVHGDAWDSLVSAAERVSRAPLWIDDTAALSLVELRSKIRRKQAEFDTPEHKISIVVVDYLQLMTAGGGHGNREQEVSEISRGLKGIAKELKVPVVALSQLSRKCEERQNKRPGMADLRESGAIEQDADIIAFIYRHEYYCSAAGDECPENLRGVAEVNLAKQRNGPAGSDVVVKLKFDGLCVRFDNLPESHGASR